MQPIGLSLSRLHLAFAKRALSARLCAQPLAPGQANGFGLIMLVNLLFQRE
jgi:hypothetical protein